MNLVQAIRSALHNEMSACPGVVVMGEDVGALGGVFRVTEGLLKQFGDARVIDMPLAENGIVGMAIGMAMAGMRPVVEIQFADFIFPAFDQIVSEAARLRYRSGGEFSLPMVIRAPMGGGVGGGVYHSQSPEAHFIHTPGLKVVCPSTPHDAKGLLISALRDEDPVLFFEPKRSYRSMKMEVSDDPYTIPLGQAATLRVGVDATVVTWGGMVPEVLMSADELACAGIECEVIDLRTVWPLDTETVIESTKKTGRVVIVHEAPRTCGLGSEIVALVTESCFSYLEAPPERVTGWDVPIGYALEDLYLPLRRRISPAIRRVVGFRS